MKFLPLIFMITLSSCAMDPMMRVSNKADWNDTIESLSIVYLGSKLGAQVSYIKEEEFLKIDDEFVKLGIATDTYLFTGLEFDEEKKLEYYRAKNDYLLIIDPTVIATGQYGGTNAITYRLNLYETKKNKKIWVAELRVSFGWTEGVYHRFDEMSIQIVNRLNQDGLVAGPASTNNKG